MKPKSIFWYFTQKEGYKIGNMKVDLEVIKDGKQVKPLSFSPVTVDCARNMAEKVGYLDKTNKAGIYRVVKHFAADYTVSQLRKDYDRR